MDEIHGIVTEMRYGSEFRIILAQYASLMRHKAEKNLEEWALNFQANKSSFEETLFGFGKENVTGYLNEVFKQKCSDSLVPLFETYK